MSENPLRTQPCLDCCPGEARCACDEECYLNSRTSAELAVCLALCQTPESSCAQACEGSLEDLQGCYDDRKDCHATAVMAWRVAILACQVIWVACLGACSPGDTACQQACDDAIASCYVTAQENLATAYGACNDARDTCVSGLSVVGCLNVCEDDAETCAEDCGLTCGGDCEDALDGCITLAGTNRTEANEECGDTQDGCEETCENQFFSCVGTSDACATEKATKNACEAVCWAAYVSKSQSAAEALAECREGIGDLPYEEQGDASVACNNAYESTMGAAQIARNNCLSNCRAPYDACIATYEAEFPDCTETMNECMAGCEEAGDRCFEDVDLDYLRDFNGCVETFCGCESDCLETDGICVNGCYGVSNTCIRETGVNWTLTQCNAECFCGEEAGVNLCQESLASAKVDCDRDRRQCAGICGGNYTDCVDGCADGPSGDTCRQDCTNTRNDCSAGCTEDHDECDDTARGVYEICRATAQRTRALCVTDCTEDEVIRAQQCCQGGDYSTDDYRTAVPLAEAARDRAAAICDHDTWEPCRQSCNNVADSCETDCDGDFDCEVDCFAAEEKCRAECDWDRFVCTEPANETEFEAIAEAVADYMEEVGAFNADFHRGMAAAIAAYEIEVARNAATLAACSAPCAADFSACRIKGAWDDILQTCYDNCPGFDGDTEEEYDQWLEDYADCIADCDADDTACYGAAEACGDPCTTAKWDDDNQALADRVAALATACLSAYPADGSPYVQCLADARAGRWLCYKNCDSNGDPTTFVECKSDCDDDMELAVETCTGQHPETLLDCHPCRGVLEWEEIREPWGCYDGTFFGWRAEV